MASILKRQTTRGVRYDVRYRTPDGGVRTKTVRTRRDAERVASTVEADKIRGAFVDPRAGAITFDEYSTRWLAERANLRPNTRVVYEQQLRTHIAPTFAKLQLSTISPAKVRSWQSAKLRTKLSPNTVAKCYRLLRTIMNTAVEDELIVRNPCMLKGAAVERADERPIATAEQVWQLAIAVPERYRCMILLAGFVGLRQGELLGLERRHIDLMQSSVRVEQQSCELPGGVVSLAPPKTAAGVRTIAIPAFLVVELRAHLDTFGTNDPNSRLFVNDAGAPVRKGNLHEWWVAARKQVDLPEGFRFHDLRHTANTLTAAHGASTAELMARLGHASPAAALRYQHATRSRDKELANLVGATFEAARPSESTVASEAAIEAIR